MNEFIEDTVYPEVKVDRTMLLLNSLSLRRLFEALSKFSTVDTGKWLT